MEYIYSRVSTEEQVTLSQLHELKRRYPRAIVVEENASGAKARPKLESLLAALNSGDTLAIYALDRLGRRCGELVLLLDTLTTRGVVLVSLRESIDMSTLGGRFIGQVFAALSELERGLISERTKAALQARRASGQRLGRPNKIATDVVLKLSGEGVSVVSIAATLGVSESGIRRVLKLCGR